MTLGPVAKRGNFFNSAHEFRELNLRRGMTYCCNPIYEELRISLVVALFGFLAVAAAMAQTNSGAPSSSESFSEPFKMAKDPNGPKPLLDLAARPSRTDSPFFW